MYSFLLEARIKPEADYQFFTYRGKKPITLDFRGNPVIVDTDMRFCVRPSSNGKHIRLIFPKDPTRVFTIDLKTANELANGVGKP